MTRKQLKILIAILSFIIILFAITIIYYFGNNAYRSSKAGVIELNDSNFEEKVLKADEPVLVEFYSNFCFPCIQMFSVINSIAENNKDIRVGKVNVYDKESTRLIESFNISATPIMLLFENGEVKSAVVGARSEEELMKELKLNE